MGKRGWHLGWAAAVVAVAAGCWPVPGQNADRTSYNASETAISVATVGSLAEDWTAPVDLGPVGAPVLSGRWVHVVDGNAVYAFVPSSGARRWRTPLADQEPGFAFTTAGPFVHGDDVLGNVVHHVFGGGGETVVLDGATGAVEQTIGTGHLQSIRSTRGVGVWTNAGTDVPRSTVLKRVDLAAGTSVGDALLDVPGFSDRRPLLTLGAERIYETGHGPLPPFGTFSSPPFAWTTFGATGPGIRALGWDTDRGCLAEGELPPPTGPIAFYDCGLWATPVDGTATAPVIGPGENVLYTGTDAGTVYAVDAAGGAVLWTAAVGSSVTAPPALAEGWLYVPTADGLVVLGADGCGAPTCVPAWQADTAGPALQPAVANGVVFTASTSAAGDLRAFAADGCGAATCDPIWSTATGSPATGAPAVSAGRLYVGTADGRLVSYR